MLKTIRSWFKGTDAFELGAIIFIFVGIFLVGVAIFLGVFTNIKITGGDNWDNITQYSEFIAGMIGGVWSLAGVLLFYSSLSSQKADLEAQKDLLVKQIDEVVAQTKEFRIQNEMSKEQKNEETFFQLLRFHNEIIDSIQIEQNEIDFASGENITKTVNGRRAFVEYYDIYKRFFGEQSESYQNDSEEELAKVFDKSYNMFYLEYQADLGHYFRNLFNLLYFIDTQKESQKEFFLNLLMAQLSNFELTLLFFHCLRKHNTDFKELVEKYSILGQVPKDEVTSMAHSLYDSKAFGADGFGSGEIIQDELGQIDDLDTDSLLSQISNHADDLMEGKKKEKKSGGLGLMEDLLSRIDNIPKEVGSIPKTEINNNEDVEGEEESLDFLEQFFDNSNKEHASAQRDEDPSPKNKPKPKEEPKESLPDISSFFDDDVEEQETETIELPKMKVASDEDSDENTEEVDVPDLSNFFDDEDEDESEKVAELNAAAPANDDVIDLSSFMDDEPSEEANSFEEKSVQISDNSTEEVVDLSSFMDDEPEALKEISNENSEIEDDNQDEKIDLTSFMDDEPESTEEELDENLEIDQKQVDLEDEPLDLASLIEEESDQNEDGESELSNLEKEAEEKIEPKADISFDQLPELDFEKMEAESGNNLKITDFTDELLNEDFDQNSSESNKENIQDPALDKLPFDGVEDQAPKTPKKKIKINSKSSEKTVEGKGFLSKL